MSMISARVTVGAFTVFGSGGSDARLTLKSGRRVPGIPGTTVHSDNGFVGFYSREVRLYPKTKVIYTRGTYPGGSVRFEGTWGALCAQRDFPLVKEWRR